MSSLEEQVSQIKDAIARLEAQRAILGDGVVDTSVAVLREKLAGLQPEPTPEQRKLVTVLFCDLVGFTPMAERMDHEDVREVLNLYFGPWREAIIRHGGRLHKFIGDAVMAVFGIPTASEDDPENAIRTALEVRDGLDVLNATIEGRYGVRLAMRMGINTGSVLVGEVGRNGELTVTGDAVNLASRLEGKAPTNGILISHDTYRHVRGVFEAQVQAPMIVKGKTDPIQAYVVQRARPRAFHRGMRGVEGVETRMIGREAELVQLQEALCAAMRDNLRQMVTIVGEAGVGKSRLVYEFENWVDLLPERVFLFKGRASREMQGVPYSLIRDLFAFRFQIQDSDSAGVVREKLEQGIGEVLGEGVQGEIKAQIIGQLLGFDFSESPHLQGVLDDAKQLHDRGLIYLGDYFKAGASQHPTVILLEDLHWADDSSLDVLNSLALSMPDRPLLIVCLARRSLLERRSRWGEGQSFHGRLELHPLSKRESQRLVEEILKKAEQVPGALRELLIRNAEGNPFYLEELIKMLVEDGVIVPEEEQWRIEPTRLRAVPVPPTLVGVLQARLDRLPTGERAVIQQASVVGRRFWDRAVVRLGESGAEATDEPGVLNALSVLRDREMVYRRATSGFVGAREYIFKHALLREVTYESVLKRVRRVYHALVAEWLMEQSGERAGEYTGLIADHLEAAGRAEEAIAYLRQAGEQAARQFANGEAVTYFSRALDLIQKDDPAGRTAEHYDLLLAREKVHDLCGNRGAQARDLATLEVLAKTLGEERREAEVALRQASYAEVTADYLAAATAAQESIRLSQAAQDAQLEAAGYRQWGRMLRCQGDLAAARTQLEAALTLTRDTSLRAVEAEVLRDLGVIFWQQGDSAQARASFEESLRLCRAIGDRRAEGSALNNLGNACRLLGDYAQAREYLTRALGVRREIGDRWGEASTLSNLGYVYSWRGDYALGRTHLEQAVRICREIGFRHCERTALHELGGLSRRLGDYAAARTYHEQDLRISREINDRLAESEALDGLGQLFHYLGDDESARQHIQQALRIAQDLGIRSTQAYALTDLGHVQVGLKCLPEAAAAYRQALDLRRSLGQEYMTMEALAGLAQVALAQDNQTQAQAYVEEILGYLEGNTLDGTDEPLRVYLTCYQVLQANHDSRAQEILTAAYSLLKEQAAKITDEGLRRSFLENVAVHREMLTEWTEKHQGGLQRDQRVA